MQGDTLCRLSLERSSTTPTWQSFLQRSSPAPRGSVRCRPPAPGRATLTRTAHENPHYQKRRNPQIRANLRGVERACGPRAHSSPSGRSSVGCPDRDSPAAGCRATQPRRHRRVHPRSTPPIRSQTQRRRSSHSRSTVRAGAPSRFARASGLGPSELGSVVTKTRSRLGTRNERSGMGQRRTRAGRCRVAVGIRPTGRRHWFPGVWVSLCSSDLSGQRNSLGQGGTRAGTRPCTSSSGKCGCRSL